MDNLLVIGAGLAGLTAAYRAAKNGKHVTVIAKGLSATHWSAGTIDALGYFPDDKTPVQNALDAVNELTRANPQHPYALLDSHGVADAMRDFLSVTQEIGLPYVNATNAGDNLWLPSPIGAARPTFLAPTAQLAGDLKRTEPMLIVGLRGLRDFYPELIAENLNKQGHSARAEFLPLDLLTERHDSNNIHLAMALDDPARCAKLGEALKKIVKPGERIGFPAILGLNAHADVMRDLQMQIGASVFEIPTLPPSVPGIRLHAALTQHLRKLGVRVDVNMKVIGFHVEDNRVLWVESDASSRPLKHRAEKFLLATGGILGGGIASDHTGKIWDAVFNLPLCAPTKRAEWFRSKFFEPAGHPVFRGGVIVNRDFQPVDANGARVFENVFATGNVLAHADAILERSHEGIAIATGFAAGQKV
jgi:glycerol-3-phosphate dehydrogenase subunit B